MVRENCRRPRRQKMSALDLEPGLLEAQARPDEAADIRPILKGQKCLVVGIANEHSIAYGCAKAFRELGADLALTYLNDKAKPYVEPLARALEAPLFLPLDFAQAGMLEAVFERIKQTWDRLDIIVHSAAFAPK